MGKQSQNHYLDIYQHQSECILRSRRLFNLILAFIPLLFATGWVTLNAATELPNRQTEIVVAYTEYEWWLIRWSNNNAECRILIDHEGLPNGDDVYVYCGDSLFQEWLDTEACPAAVEGEDISGCSGLYLHQIASEPLEKIILVDLPMPEAWISFSGCTPVPPENHCEELPNLLITAEEPLPNEHITQIQGTYNGIPFMCEGDSCEVPLRPTPEEGVEVVFWADSSFGDASEHYTALIRVIDGGVSLAPDSGGWFVDIMSTRWHGEQSNGCAPIWGAFTPVEGLPAWLTSPEWPELLASDEPYTYLAGRLIAQGIVDASECPGGGLEENGYANTCGLETARPEVDEWQNRFDAQIVEAAQSTGIPAQLMKNLFAQESQFWPGAFNGAEEYGLGQLTEMGADTVLLWNTAFYNQFCPLVLDINICQAGYAQLDEENQAILRGALAIEVRAECPECPAGIDLNDASFSVELFAQTLKANCQQAGQIVTNVSGETPGAVSSYEDLWRFTLVNYHAGPGCLSTAINEVSSQTLTWEDVSAELSVECPGAEEYVEKISK